MDEIGSARVNILFGAVSLLLALGACNPFSDPSSADAMTVAPEGTGSVFVRRDGRDIEVTGRFTLDPGDVVRTGSLPARVRLEGPRGARVAADSRVRVAGGDSLELLEGSLLAESSALMTVGFDDVLASTSDGTVRIDRDLASAEAASYRGVAELAAPGQESMMLRPLFEASVAANEVLNPRPYRIDAGDPWDRSMLTDVVELDEQLQRYARAMKGQLETVGPAYFGGLGGAPAERAMSRYVDQLEWSSPDLLIGFSIAELDGRRDFGASLHTAFRLNRAGGAWGVVATIMRIPAEPLFANLENAILAAGAIASRSEAAGAPAGDGVVPPAASPGAPADRGDVTRGEAAGGADGPGNEAGSSDGSPGGSDDGSGGGGNDQPPEEDDCANLIDCLLDGLTPPGPP